METSGAAVFGEALLGFSGGVHSAAARELIVRDVVFAASLYT